MNRILLLVSLLSLAGIDAAATYGQSQLPQPDPEFKGKVGETYKDSTANFPMPVKVAKGSPNVLLILLDDVGFGMCSTFGGPVPTPHMDKLATNGLKYNRFHTTALCSPYYPTIYRNTSWVPQPKTPEQGYHFTADMTDEAIAWTRNIRAANPDKPWFNYFSTSGVHAPHHAPKAWREKYIGKFDHGWDQQRELTHAKQIDMGIIPKATKLTPRPKEIPAWADQSADARKVYTRLMENYAANMAYTDFEVGRLVESLRESGELDNTLLMYIVGDNGASAEGGLEGTFSEIASLIGVQLGLDSSIN